MQHIVVCTQDSVLAKKVRFLLARDECEVEILSNPSGLAERLRRGGLSMLVLSRELEGEDAIELLARLDPDMDVPSTLVLGGAQKITADYIHLIPDPIDTQAIYRIASEILSEDDTAAHQVTQMGVDAPPRRRRTTLEDAPPSDNEQNELAFGDVDGLDEIADRLEELEDDSAEEDVVDAFSVSEEAEPSEVSDDPSTNETIGPVLGGMLEPARFAKVLYECWAQQTSGALIVAREGETLTISFEDGAPVHVQSSVPGDPLGPALVARDRITDDEYGEGAKRAIEKGLRLGTALVELGYFTTEELGEELGQSANEQIASCFEASQGAFEFDPKRTAPTPERPYRLDVPHILSDGLRRHADAEVVRSIVGEVEARYFKLKRGLAELKAQYPLDDRDEAFLEYEGRAYNVSDAAEICQLSLESARSLMALLTITDEVTDFTPGVTEFEARIREERQRSRDLRAVEDQPHDEAPAPAPAPPPMPMGAPEAVSLPPAAVPLPGARDVTREVPPHERPKMETPPPVVHSVEPPAPPAAPPPPSSPPPPPPVSKVAPPPSPPPKVGPNGEEIPAMPVPSNGEDGMPIRPLVFAKPLPRGPDGSALETPERSLSREHFQRGVALLGQGNFANAEEAFRDAVALCAEEHVYLIGLARAIYYNPAYKADGKLPVLKSIVGRADHLAPDDKRVATLKTWVRHAEAQMPAMM